MGTLWGISIINIHKPFVWRLPSRLVWFWENDNSSISSQTWTATKSWLPASFAACCERRRAGFPLVPVMVIMDAYFITRMIIDILSSPRVSHCHLLKHPSWNCLPDSQETNAMAIEDSKIRRKSLSSLQITNEKHHSSPNGISIYTKKHVFFAFMSLCFAPKSLNWAGKKNTKSACGPFHVPHL
jgi:hypothetical protein